MTSKQSKQVDKILNDTWNRIYDEVITPDQKDAKGIVKDKGFLFDIEDKVQAFASEIGLAAF